MALLASKKHGSCGSVSGSAAGKWKRPILSSRASNVPWKYRNLHCNITQKYQKYLLLVTQGLSTNLRHASMANSPIFEQLVLFLLLSPHLLAAKFGWIPFQYAIWNGCAQTIFALYIVIWCNINHSILFGPYSFPQSDLFPSNQCSIRRLQVFHGLSARCRMCARNSSGPAVWPVTAVRTWRFIFPNDETKWQ